MLKKFFVLQLIILGSFTLGSTSSFGQGIRGLVCDTRSKIVDSLTKQYKESPLFMGLSSGGSIVEVFASATGSWTMVVTNPNGRSCLMDAGQNWETLPMIKVGEEI